MIRILPSLAIAALLAGCATDPAKTVFRAKTGLTAAEASVLTYDQLPRCSGAPSKLCSDPKTVILLQTGKNTARDSINQAEAAVKNPTTGQSAAVQWATVALSAVQALLTSLQGATK